MEHVIHNDYRQQPIPSDEAREQYRQYLARLEVMIADQEDTIRHLRTTGVNAHLASAHTSPWRLLTKRQSVIDALAAYDQQRGVRREA